MKVLISGGTGFIGARAARALLTSGHDVVLLDNAVDERRHARLVEMFGAVHVGLVRGDVLDRAGLESALREGGVDAVVHLAYMLGAASRRDVRRSTEVNLMGTANVLDVARAVGVSRVVCASSLSVFGADDRYPADQLPLGDDAPQLVAAELRLYGASKVYVEAMAESYRQSDDLLVVGLRPSIVYGGAPANGSIEWVFSSVSAAAEGRAVDLPNREARVQLVHVDDVADQLAALVAAPADRFGPDFFFNSGGDTCTIAEYAEALRDVFPDASVSTAAGGQPHLMGLAASVSGRGIDALVGRPRHLSPLARGLARYADDIRSGQIHH